jgi:uncharacterized protein (TIRG00374 family)
LRKNLFKYAKKFLPLIGIVILFYIIYSLDIEEIKNAFLSINPLYIFVALLLTLPRVLVRNFGWQLIQKEQKIKLSYFRSLKIFLIGFFYCSITPSFIGHLMRAPYMKEETGEPYGKLFVNIIIDSTLRTISSYLMIFTGTLLVIVYYPDPFWNNSSIFVIVLIVFLIILSSALYFIKKERGEKLFHTLIKYIIPKKLKDSSYKFVNTFYKDFPTIYRLIPPLLLSFIVWIFFFTQEYIIVMAMGLDSEIPYHFFILLFPLANVAGYLPITFAGLGVREGTSIFIFTTLFGVGEAEIFVFTLVGFIITDIFTGFIGFLVTLTETGEKKSIPI